MMTDNLTFQQLVLKAGFCRKMLFKKAAVVDDYLPLAYKNTTRVHYIHKRLKS